MKIERIPSNLFQPITMTVTITSQEELDALHYANEHLTRSSVESDMDSHLQANIIVTLIEAIAQVAHGKYEAAGTNRNDGERPWVSTENA